MDAFEISRDPEDVEFGETTDVRHDWKTRKRKGKRTPAFFKMI